MGNRERPMSYEIQGNLARLLATENLVVEHKPVETASFDVDKRVLTLPIWEGSERLFTMLVGHEVGHALYTPNDSWDSWIGEVPKSYVNVTEDARIEKLMKRKFPGLVKDFYVGYKELNSRDFFGVRDEDLSQLNLIDRINLYYKIGSYQILPFDEDEKRLRDLVGASETFEEAIAAARAIYEYAKKEMDSVQQISNPSSEDAKDDKSGSTTMESSESESENETTDDVKSDQQPDADWDEPADEDPLESVTDTNLNENLRENSLRHYPNGKREFIEIDDQDLSQTIVSWDRIKVEMEKFWTGSNFDPDHEDFLMKLDFTFCDGEYRKFKRECAREVNYLSKEFEMKKSAAAYARQQVSRTGVLNTSILHTYKYNEDLFKKVSVTPDGKNHGLIFLLDWSGSMAECIHDTFKQLMSLCLFCRKSGIPFQVYTFIQDGQWSDGNEEYDGRAETFFVGKHFHLLNILSSDQNNRAFDEACLYVWRCTAAYYYNYGPGYRCPERHQIPQYVPPALSLGGTPLNEAIVCLQTLIPQFKAKYNVEKTHVTILTDGEAQQSAKYVEREWKGEKTMLRSALYSDVALRDRKTGRTYMNARITNLLLRYMKGRFPECNFLGFRIISTRDLMYYMDRETAGTTPESFKKAWNKNKTAMATVGGFQELYFMSTKALNIDTEFEVAEDASKAVIKRAFTKSLQAKSNNKKILSSFIGQIA